MTKFRGFTKPLLKRYSALAAKREAAFQAIFDAALPHQDIPWQTCYRDHATSKERAAYDAASSDVFEFECEMVYTARRGYFENGNGHFNWY